MDGDLDAEILVRVAWYRIDQGDLRTTTLKQKWHDFKGDFKLVDEGRADGDLGLIGEYVPVPAPAPTAKTSAQFPTVRLGQAPARSPAMTESDSAEAPTQ
jgi:hypothetical protein